MKDPQGELSTALVQIDCIEISEQFVGKFNEYVVRLRLGASEKTVSGSGVDKRSAVADAFSQAIFNGWF